VQRPILRNTENELGGSVEDEAAAARVPVVSLRREVGVNRV